MAVIDLKQQRNESLWSWDDQQLRPIRVLSEKPKMTPEQTISCCTSTAHRFTHHWAVCPGFPCISPTFHTVIASRMCDPSRVAKLKQKAALLKLVFTVMDHTHEASFKRNPFKTESLVVDNISRVCSWAKTCEHEQNHLFWFFVSADSLNLCGFLTPLPVHTSS